MDVILANKFDDGDNHNIYAKFSGHELRVMRYRLMDKVYVMLYKLVCN